MSLSLLQSYSSEEEEVLDGAIDSGQESDDQSSSGDEDASRLSHNRYKPLSDPNPSSSSLLPSAAAAFSEVSGPPEFLNNSVVEAAKEVEGQRWRPGRRKDRKAAQKGLPAGAVVEAKALLVGIHERVRSDVEGSVNRTTSSQSTASVGSSQGVKRVLGATDPDREDAAELLRICLTCGVPKTYSNARGIVCPLCGDRPPAETENDLKKKGSAVKDKEKLKRMKGQSSHATWKSETEMQLRQQFD